MRKLVLLLLVCVGVSGCGGSERLRSAPPVTSREWLSVVNDWLDNKTIDGRHTCGALIEAVAQMSALSHTRVEHPSVPDRSAILAFDRYATKVCPRRPHISKIVVGMSDADVAAVAGMPRTPRLHCWLYPVTGANDGRRVCFAHGRVVLVQHSVHF